MFLITEGKVKKLVAISLMLVILITFLATPVLAAGPSLYRASGGGTSIYINFWDGDKYPNTYTFTVQQLDEAGNAKGHFVVIFGHSTEVHHRKIEADLKFVYFEGNTVWMSGIITHCYDPWRVGRALLFAAQDNGEGIQATGPDKVSGVVSGGPVGSAIDQRYRSMLGFPSYGFDLTNGNVQIK